MTDQKHSPEPWNKFRETPDKFYIKARNGNEIGTMYAEDALRVISCVNALEGWAEPSAAKDLLEAAKVLLQASSPDIRLKAIKGIRFTVSRIEGRK